MQYLLKADDFLLRVRDWILSFLRDWASITHFQLLVVSVIMIFFEAAFLTLHGTVILGLILVAVIDFGCHFRFRITKNSEGKKLARVTYTLSLLSIVGAAIYFFGAAAAGDCVYLATFIFNNYLVVRDDDDSGGGSGRKRKELLTKMTDNIREWVTISPIPSPV